MPDLTVPAAPALANVRRVPLVHAGQWDALTGRATFSTDDLYAAVAAMDCAAVRRPVLKFGHDGNHGVGNPALGHVDNMQVAGDGTVLLGDYVGMPGWLAATNDEGQSVLSSAYPDRSIEGEFDYRCQVGHSHPFVIHAVALLGQERPAIGTLPSLPDLAELYGVAASTPEPTGTQVTVVVCATEENTMPSPAKVAAGVTTEDVRRKYYDGAPWSHWIVEMELDPLQLIVTDDDTGKRYRVPVTVTAEDEFTFGPPVEVAVRYIDKTADVAASIGKRMVFASRAESRPGDRPAASEQVEPNPAVEPVPAPPVVDPAPVAEPPTVPAAEPEPTPEPKEDLVSTSKSDIRSRLGLPADADQDAVDAAVLAKLDETAQPTEPTPTEPVSAPEPELTPEPQRQPEPVSASTGRDDALNEMRREIERLSGEVAASKADKAAQVKASVFHDAVQKGKIAPSDRTSWEARYDKAPDVITDVLASIQPGTAVPVSPTGVIGEAEATAEAFDDAEYNRVFGEKQEV